MYDKKTDLAGPGISTYKEVSKILPNDYHALLPPLKRMEALYMVKEYIEKLARNKEYTNKFWLEIFNFMHENGVPVYPWKFKENMKWQEVDFHIDLNKAKELLNIKMNLV